MFLRRFFIEMLRNAHIQWFGESEILSQLFVSAVDSVVKGCVVWVSCGRWPYWHGYWFSSIDFGRNHPDIELDTEECWTGLLLPQRMGSQELHWRLFLIDFKSVCCNMYHINLAGQSQQSSNIADTTVMCTSWVGCVCGTIHLQQRCAMWSPRFTAWLHTEMGPKQTSLPKGPLV